MGGRAPLSSSEVKATDTASTKGLKAGGNISINNGTFTIDAADDAVHSNSNIAITGGDLTIMTGDDGIHADALVEIAGGTINIMKSYEGIEGANIIFSGGIANVVSIDDGVNASDGNDDVATNEGRRDQFNKSSNNLITISGGWLVIEAAGDGVDSNGSISMTGGTVIVNGPTNNGNGALDYDGSFEQSGGMLIAAGSAGMSQTPSDSSSQYSVSMTYSQTQQAGTLVHIEDSKGNTVLSFIPSKNYQSVVVSSPDLKKGDSYIIYTGGSMKGTETDGLYTDGKYEGGTKVTEFQITNSVTWLNESGVTTGGNIGPGPGGNFGQRPSGGGEQGPVGNLGQRPGQVPGEKPEQRPGM